MQSAAKARGVCLLGTMALLMTIGGCKKQTPTAPPPAPTPAPAPAPAPARPTVTLQASQTFIQRGEATTLNWSSTHATELTLTPGVGRVSPEGSTRVNPTDSTSYTITARGPGGTQDATVRITVAAPSAPAPTPAPRASLDELFRSNVLDVYYDLDKADIRADARGALAKTAEFLRQNGQVKISVEGHCDERGSTEYNLALGDRRAQAAKQFLVSLGVSADRIETVSWGKERPFCTASSEDCWQQNRRAHFVLAR
jgi:peptidoglycan-associated lipoprotein